MPRGPRLLVDGAFYHIYSRGNRRQVVFIDDLDRRRFLKRLGEVEGCTGAVRVAHCLMTNHFHLLLRPGAGGVSALMHRVLCSYAQGFNRRHEAVGHVFQGRFGSRPLVSEEDLLTVLRYIHHNPVAAGIASGPSCWTWSSHGAHLASVPPPELACGVLLVRGLLSPHTEDAVRAYRELMDEPPPTDEAVFPAAPALKAHGPCPQMPHGEDPHRPPTLGDIASRVASLWNVSLPDLTRGARRREFVRARRAFIRQSVEQWGYPLREVAEMLGYSIQSVHRHLSRGQVPRR